MSPEQRPCFPSPQPRRLGGGSCLKSTLRPQAPTVSMRANGASPPPPNCLASEPVTVTWFHVTALSSGRQTEPQPGERTPGTGCWAGWRGGPGGPGSSEATHLEEREAPGRLASQCPRVWTEGRKGGGGSSSLVRVGAGVCRLPGPAPCEPVPPGPGAAVPVTPGPRGAQLLSRSAASLPSS